MSTTYTQTVEFSVWKQHTCASCSTVFRYLFKRTMKGEGASPKAAEKAAQKAVVNALEREVDLHPCPGCGLYQPDMVASVRSRRHWWTFWAGVPVYGLLLILVLTDLLSYTSGAVAAFLCTLPLALAHLLIDLNNPNSNLEANRKLGKRLAKDGDLWIPEDEQPDVESEPEPVGKGINGGHLFSYVLLGAAVLAFLLPIGVRLAFGMKGNADWHPEIAGPGDSPYVWFPEKISSVKSLWNGQPRVTVTNQAEVGVPVNVGTAAKTDNWGGTMSVKSSEKNSSFTPWARVILPNDPALAGKTLQLRIDMTVTFPAMMGGNSFSNQTRTVSRTATLQLSSARAGGMFQGSFWAGFLGGTTFSCLAGMLLPVFSNRFRSRALPTSIFVPEGQGGRLDDEEEEEPEEDDRPVRRRQADEDDRPRQRVRREEEDDRPRKRRRDEDDY